MMSAKSTAFYSLLILPAILFFAALFTSFEANAEDAACPVLRGQLAKLPSVSGYSTSSGNPGEYRRFADLAKRQASALKRARRDARRLKCISRRGDVLERGGQCGALVEKIGAMRANLSRLEQKRDRFQPRQTAVSTASVQKQRRALVAKMKRLNCGAKDAKITSAFFKKKKKRGFFERLFGSGRRKSLFSNRRRALENLQPQQQEQSQSSSGGVYRTLCVRVCDGYYFPISFATFRSQFETDEALCQASNPAAEMRLFVHRNPGQESEDMVDLNGIAYAELPNAFRYRREFVGTDVCPAFDHNRNFEQVAGFDPTSADLPHNVQGVRFDLRKTSRPSPQQRPDFFSDPDTDMARAGNFELKPVNVPKQGTLAAEVQNRDYDPNNPSPLSVRIVGPTFLSDQGSVELLIDPDQIRVQ